MTNRIVTILVKYQVDKQDSHNTGKVPVDKQDSHNTGKVPVDKQDSRNTGKVPVDKQDSCNTGKVPVDKQDSCNTGEVPVRHPQEGANDHSQGNGISMAVRSIITSQQNQEARWWQHKARARAITPLVKGTPILP